MSSTSDNTKESKFSWVMSNVTTFLKFISAQKYSTVLYYKGKNQQSSIFGGLLTILCGIGVFIFSYMALSDVINLKNYNIT